MYKIILDKDVNTSEKLFKMIDNHFRVLNEDRHLAIVTQLELRQSNKELRLRINEVLKEYLDLLRCYFITKELKMVNWISV